MGLDIWFSEDIRNALLAANEGSASTAAVIAEEGDSPDLLMAKLRAYRKGYRAALVTVALAFGVAPRTIFPKPADAAPEIPARGAQALPPSASRGR